MSIHDLDPANYIVKPPSMTSASAATRGVTSAPQKFLSAPSTKDATAPGFSASYVFDNITPDYNTEDNDTNLFADFISSDFWNDDGEGSKTADTRPSLNWPGIVDADKPVYIAAVGPGEAVVTSAHNKRTFDNPHGPVYDQADVDERRRELVEQLHAIDKEIAANLYDRNLRWQRERLVDRLKKEDSVLAQGHCYGARVDSANTVDRFAQRNPLEGSILGFNDYRDAPDEGPAGPTNLPTRTIRPHDSAPHVNGLHMDPYQHGWSSGYDYMNRQPQNNVGHQQHYHNHNHRQQHVIGAHISGQTKSQSSRTHFFLMPTTEEVAWRIKCEGTIIAPDHETTLGIDINFNAGDKVLFILRHPTQHDRVFGYLEIEGNSGQGLQPSWMAAESATIGGLFDTAADYDKPTWFPVNFLRPATCIGSDVADIVGGVDLSNGVREIDYDTGSACLSLIKERGKRCLTKAQFADRSYAGVAGIVAVSHTFNDIMTTSAPAVPIPTDE